MGKQVEALLQDCCIRQYVSWEVTITGRADDTYAEIIESRNGAWADIICSIESECVPMIADEQDPNVMWDKLADANKSKCMASIYTLRTRLTNSKMTQAM